MTMQIPDVDFDLYNSYYEPMQAYIDKLVASAPGYIQRSSIGTTPQGRDLTLLTVTDFSVGTPEGKPAILSFANMHCHELSGPMAVFRTIRNLLLNDLELLKTRTFYFFPRINPDSTETIIHNSGYTRSRWDYSHRGNTFHHKDIDGDGISAQMRKECPWDEFCIDPKNPQRLIKRTADSKGPFYMLFGEGYIENWEGAMLPQEETEGDYRDWNRSWPVGWNPAIPAGGNFPLEEPEMHALATFIAKHPNIFGSINYHNGWGTIICPVDIAKADYELFDTIAHDASRETGHEVICFGNVPMFQRDQRKHDPSPIMGQCDDTLYRYFGMLPLTLELGTYENSSGYTSSDIFNRESWDDYDPIPEVMAYQAAHPNERAAFHPWHHCKHPQLGDVEVGGFDCVGLASPAAGYLSKVCEGAYRFTRAFAKRAPVMRVMNVEKERVAENVVRIRVILQNAGEYATNITSYGKNTSWRKAPYVELLSGDGTTCLSRKRCHRLPHFEGWQSRELEWFVQTEPGKEPDVSLLVEAGAAGTFTEKL